MSAAVVSEDAEELDGHDATALKDMIRELLSESDRRVEKTERLQEKLKALNNELAARKEEVDRYRKELHEQQTRNRKLAEQIREQGETGDGDTGDVMKQLTAGEAAQANTKLAEKVMHFVEEQLQTKTAKKVARNELGIRVFDETKLIVTRAPEEKDLEAVSVDTVLITFVKPHSEQQYNLTYRVGRNTKIKKLRVDACVYWGVSEVEYILRTMDLSKVHDDLTVQSCFRKGEASHLTLAQKTPMCTAPHVRELAQIGPKIGNKSRVKKDTNEKKEDKRGQGVLPSQEFYDSMKVVPGFYKFMTQRDRAMVGHLRHIKLQYICMYSIMAVITVLVFLIFRPPNTDFYCREGVRQAMTNSWIDFERGPGAVVIGFDDIGSKEQMWDWMTYTLPKRLLANTSVLRRSNYMPGWVAVRMQRIEEPSRAACAEKQSVIDSYPPDTKCLPLFLSSENQGTETLQHVQLYWEGCNQSNYTLEVCANMTPPAFYPGVSEEAGRGPSRPYHFLTPGDMDELDKEAGTEDGLYQRYDETGYQVMYDLQYKNTSDTYIAYLQDMEFLKSVDWIDYRTRSVLIEFTLYNGNYDYWISAWFLFELPPNGVVLPSLEIDLFRTIDYTSHVGSQIFFYDLARIAVAVYILVFQVYYGMWLEIKNGIAGWLQIFTNPFSVADMCIVAALVYTLFVRHVIFGYFGNDAESMSNKFYLDFSSSKTLSYVYHQHLAIEAALFALLIFRLLSFARINRHIYIILTTVGVSLKKCARYFAVFLPLFVGIVVVQHTLYGRVLREYSSFTLSFATALVEYYGKPMDLPTDSNVPYGMAFGVVFYLIFTLGLTNCWIAVLISCYQEVRVAAGYSPKTYRWKEYKYVKWALWAPFQAAYLRYLRPKIERPQTTPEDEE